MIFPFYIWIGLKLGLELGFGLVNGSMFLINGLQSEGKSYL